MYLKVSYEAEFDELMMHLKSIYPKELFDIDGIGKQTDMATFSKSFFSSKTTADCSIDANANVEDMSVIAYMVETPKPLYKYNSYYVLWYETKKLFGSEVAAEVVRANLTGDIYIHDFHGIAGGLPYCFNYSTLDIAYTGLPFVKKIKSAAPKHLIAFKSQLEQFITIAANSTLGATGLADLLIVMSYYVKRIFLTGADAHYELFPIDLAVSLTETQQGIYKQMKQLLQDRLISTFTSDQIQLCQEKGLAIYSKELFDTFTDSQHDEYISGRTEIMGTFLKSLTPAQYSIYASNIYTYVREFLTSFIYTVNQPMRGNQSPFTNISLYDDYFLKELLPAYVFVDGSTPELDMVKKLQVLFIEVMNCELARTPITFPVTSACFSIDDISEVDDNADKKCEIKDQDFLDLISKLSCKFAFMNFYAGKTSTLSSCCRLRSDITLDESDITETTHKKEGKNIAQDMSLGYINNFGSGSTKIGSLGVVTLNLPRIAMRAKGDVAVALSEIRRLTELAGKINHAKRKLVEKRIKNGNLPLYTHEFMSLKRQYSTTGIVGLYEFVQLLNQNILEKDGQALVLEMMDVINKENKKLNKHYGYYHNVEQVPAESVAVKVAKKDKLLGFDAGTLVYSNQFIPLIVNANILDRIELQGKFDRHFSGGAIAHFNVSNGITDHNKMKALIKTCIEAGVIYFAVNYNLQECENGHINPGIAETCGICQAKVTNSFTRVVGFLVNTKNFVKERRDYDYPNRVWYDANKETISTTTTGLTGNKVEHKKPSDTVVGESTTKSTQV